MKKVLIRGPLLSQSGYGVHSRQIFKWLLSEGYDVSCQVLPWGITPWYLNQESLGGLIGEIMKRTAQPNVKPDYSFQIQLPDEWDTSLANKNFGVTAAVETNFCNPAWIQACNNMHGVIVPSNFTAGVLKNSGKLSTRVHVIPESFPEEFEKDLKPTKFLNSKSKHNFLLFGQLTAPTPELDRKNTVNAIKWFCEKYKNRKDIGLIVKTNMGTNSTLDKRISVPALTQVLDQVRVGKYPRVTLVHGNMTNEELFEMYCDKTIVGLITATRGEGYGLPMIEAAACGLPVLATDWSGHKTFLQEKSWLPVNYVMKPIPNERADNRIFMQHSMWADVDEMHFKSQLGELFKKRVYFKQNCLKSRETILSKFSQKSVQTLYNSFLDEL
ncbi:MAG: glycosyltransferase family 4 protein, partial [Nitrospinae bacterium]|nr:glycosyltransferase family 4 protein [Nitrospinota bacterium]